MLILLSPAKKQAFHPPAVPYTCTQPAYLSQTMELMQALQTLSAQNLQQLMQLSPRLTELNYQRFQDFLLQQLQQDGTPALFTFQGDAYHSMQPQNFDAPTLSFAQQHLRLLSGLYGMLAPLDRLLPYRLEMKTALKTAHAKNLYLFWRNRLTADLNLLLQAESHENIIDLASQEYGKVIDDQALITPRIQVTFLEQQEENVRNIGLFAKRARGLMAGYLLRRQATHPNDLQHFSEAGYHYDSKRSTPLQAVFIRQQASTS